MSMGVRRFSASMIDALVHEAASTSRGRQYRNIHESYRDPCQRLFNAIGMDSYIRPHRHLSDPRTETLIAVRGVMTLLVFDDAGEITQLIRFGCERGCNLGVEISPGVWHTVIAEAPGAVLFEVKAGPFDPNMAKELAAWAPPEGSLEAAPYLTDLRRVIINKIGSGNA